MNGINKRKYFSIENNINMKNKTYKSRGCKETVDINCIAKPINGRFKNVDGKEIFIPKGALHISDLKDFNNLYKKD